MFVDSCGTFICFNIVLMMFLFRFIFAVLLKALPKLLRSVDWGSVEAVLETCMLLERCEDSCLDVEVAMELLDCHLVDEGVRTIAVQRLDELANDHVLRFLLQLVQVRHLYNCLLLLFFKNKS